MIDFSDRDGGVVDIVEDSVDVIETDLKFIRLNPEWAFENSMNNILILGRTDSDGNGCFIRKYQLRFENDTREIMPKIMSLTFVEDETDL